MGHQRLWMESGSSSVDATAFSTPSISPPENLPSRSKPMRRLSPPWRPKEPLWPGGIMETKCSPLMLPPGKQVGHTPIASFPSCPLQPSTRHEFTSAAATRRSTPFPGRMEMEFGNTKPAAGSKAHRSFSPMPSFVAPATVVFTPSISKKERRFGKLISVNPSSPRLPLPLVFCWLGVRMERSSR